MKNGTAAAFAAYFLWGLLPAYWKMLSQVPAVEIIGHRLAWSLVVVAIYLAIQRRREWLTAALQQPKMLLPYLGTAALLGANWLIYIWGVNSGQIVETSLGYFINPLVNVLLGVVVLRERMRPWQTAALLLALAGVIYLTVTYGRFPWIAISLALTFGFYALVRKTGALEAVEGFTVEMAILFVPAAAYLAYLAGSGSGAFGAAGAATTLLLAGAGLATAVPMVLFNYGARRVTLTSLGFLQYIAPTLQLLLGVVVYREQFDQSRLIGFVMIWAALLLYSIESLVKARRRPAPVPAPSKV